MGTIAAGGLIETYADVIENLDISQITKKCFCINSRWSFNNKFMRYLGRYGFDGTNK